MDNLKDYSETQLLKFINDAERDHNEKKQDIRNVLDEYKEVEDRLNNEMDILSDIEKRYVQLMVELNERGK